LVDLIGIEPMTSSMPWKRAPSCATGPLCFRPLLAATFLVSLIRGATSTPFASLFVERWVDTLIFL